jgi:alpha-methylacyl-CoA racemase
MQDALKGIKVLDLTMNLPGPFMTWLMAQMGADILKVENPDTGDFARNFNSPEDPGYFPVFDVVNTNKKSITLDLKQPPDREKFIDLITDYKIVVEGFRPGVLKKLGIDYEKISRIHPDVIYVSISGYGQEGSFSKKSGHDLNFQALAGCFDPGCLQDASPSVTPVAMADLGGGSLFALSGLLAAIIQRHTTGKGQHIDISLVQGVFALNVLSFCQMKRNDHLNQNDSHFLSGNQPFYYIYETSDNLHMSLGAVEPKFWIQFCKLVNKSDLIPLQFGGKKIIAQVAEIFKSRTQADWINLFKDFDVCCEPVLAIKDAVESKLAAQLNFTQKDDNGNTFLNSPIKSISKPPGLKSNREDTPAPDLGQDNNLIVRKK